jgi:hypothetical protein
VRLAGDISKYGTDAAFAAILESEVGLARRHLGADFGAQFVDQLAALLGLDMSEGPAVAGFLIPPPRSGGEGGGPKARRVGVAPRARRQRKNSIQPPLAYFLQRTLIPSYL